MAKIDFEQVANDYLLRGIQNWGQPQKDRDAAERAYVEAAGFRHGSDEAKQWLRDLCLNIRWGKFETEVEQLTEALKARA